MLLLFFISLAQDLCVQVPISSLCSVYSITQSSDPQIVLLTCMSGTHSFAFFICTMLSHT